MTDPWLDILARVRSRDDLTWEQQDEILDDYRAEAIEWGEVSLNYVTGEGQRPHGLPPAIPPSQYVDGTDVPHGTLTAYNCEGCRCRWCCDASKRHWNRVNAIRAEKMAQRKRQQCK